MTRIEFNQAKKQSRNPLLGSAINNNLTTNKVRQLFLEDNNKIDIKYNYRITIVHPAIDLKKVFLMKSFLTIIFSSPNKNVVLSKNITELRKGEFEQNTK